MARLSAAEAARRRSLKPAENPCGHFAIRSTDYYQGLDRPNNGAGNPRLCLDCYRTQERERQRSYRKGSTTAPLKFASHPRRAVREMTDEERELRKRLRDIEQSKNADRQGYVYLIAEARPLGTPIEYVKVGFSYDPWARPGELQTGNPRALVLLRSITGTEADEKAIHRRHAEHQVLGEWFRPTRALLLEFGFTPGSGDPDEVIPLTYTMNGASS